MSRTATAQEPIPLWGGLEGAPHPSQQLGLIGHGQEERALLSAYQQQRLHHAWILGGAEGIGKATLAYRMARFVMVNPDPAAPQVQGATTLDVDPNHPAARQAMHLSHPDIMVLQRTWNTERKVFYGDIRVDDVRRAINFFHTTAGAGGWRVCIVDTADDLRTAGANAFLKILEEPPPKCLFLIVTAKPRSLLPTIRSRCRMLPMNPLGTDDLVAVMQRLPDLTGDYSLPELQQMTSLAEGSVRQALSLIESDALSIRQSLDALLASLPDYDPRAAFAFSEKVAGRDSDQAYDLAMRTIMDWIHAQATANTQASHKSLARWPDLWEKTAQAVREAAIYNLDRRPLMLGLLHDLAKAVRH